MHCGILINMTYFLCFQSSAISAIWPWLKTSIIPNVYPFRAYNGEILDYYNQQFIYNIDGLLLGPVRLKQNRDSIGKTIHEPTYFSCEYVSSMTSETEEKILWILDMAMEIRMGG